MSWEVTKLLDVCDFQGGTQPPKSEWASEYKSGFIRMLQIRDFTQGKDSFIEFVKDSNRLKKCKKEDILIGRYGASIGKILTGLEGAYNVALVKTVPSEQLDRMYLYYFLLTPYFQNFIQNAGSRAAQAGFNKDELGELEIPLPPLATQKRIAEILDKADALHRKDQELLKKYDELAQSIFIDMFGDPVKNEKGWELKKLNTLVAKIESGWSPVCEQKARTSFDEWAVLKLGAVSYREYNPSENKALPKNLEPDETIAVHQGDFLLSRKNTRELVGAAALVLDTPTKLMMPDTIFRLIIDENHLNKIYLWMLINNAKFRKLIQNLASGSSGSMPNISKEKLMEFEIPVPPIKIQNKFSEIVVKNRCSLNIIQNGSTASGLLFNSLLKQAFDGELVK